MMFPSNAIDIARTYAKARQNLKKRARQELIRRFVAAFSPFGMVRT
jgi:hypothetical protein